MEFRSIINWNSPFPFLGMLGCIFHFYSNFDRIFCEQTVETMRSMESNLSLHCLPTFHKKDVRPQKHFCLRRGPLFVLFFFFRETYGQFDVVWDNSSITAINKGDRTR